MGSPTVEASADHAFADGLATPDHRNRAPASWNKHPRSIGEYRRRICNLIDAGLNLVEIDLLRAGERPTIRDRVPGDHDYFVTVIRSSTPHQMAVWPWRLRERLSVVPVPLKPEDRDAMLDLQGIFEAIFDRSGYDYMLKYDRNVTPPLNEADQEWVRAVLRDHRDERNR